MPQKMNSASNLPKFIPKMPLFAGGILVSELISILKMSIVWQGSGRRQAGRERGMPGLLRQGFGGLDSRHCPPKLYAKAEGPIPSRLNAAPTVFSRQTLRVADLLGEEQRCRRGASLFEDCSLGYALLPPKTLSRCPF
jgi:hypothetical protein